jgi:undecaprenyl-diphosphatase
VSGLQKGRPVASREARLGWYILVGSIPAALAGLSLEGPLEAIFSSPTYAAFFLIGTAVLLVAGERALSARKSVEQMTWADAIIIGLFQMLALLPGISRSGSTITAALWRGLDRPAAARYSFLLGIPAILGAGLLALLDILAAHNLASLWPLLLAAFFSASLSGYICIRFLLNWLRQRTLYIFAAYCACFGGIYLALSSFI